MIYLFALALGLLFVPSARGPGPLGFVLSVQQELSTTSKLDAHAAKLASETIETLVSLESDNKQLLLLSMQCIALAPLALPFEGPALKAYGEGIALRQDTQLAIWIARASSDSHFALYFNRPRRAPSKDPCTVPSPLRWSLAPLPFASFSHRDPRRPAGSRVYDSLGRRPYWSFENPNVRASL